MSALILFGRHYCYLKILAYFILSRYLTEKFLLHTHFGSECLRQITAVVIASG